MKPELATLIQVRPASITDVSAVAQAKFAIWPNERPAEEQIRAALANPDHASFVAIDAGIVVGFVDGFITRDSNRLRRWEVDLLGVHPEYRGRCIATQLVRTSTDAGRRMQATRARALVHIQNIASQRTFARCDYELDATRLNLYVSSDTVFGAVEPAPHANLIPVQTFSYNGFWIEEPISRETLIAGQAARTHHGFDLVGVLIPADHTESNNAAQAFGFTCVGQYQWWCKDIPQSTTRNPGANYA